MKRTDSGCSARQYFAALGDVFLEFYRILVVYILAFINAELTHFPAFAVVLPVVSVISQTVHPPNNNVRAFRGTPLVPKDSLSK